jgi:hypothetical protein
MSDNVNYLFGAKALIVYDRCSFAPLGIFRAISTMEFTREVEGVLLSAGHYNGPFAVESGEPANAFSGTVMEFPNFAYTALDNATQVDTLGEDSTGFVGAIANKNGTSIANATTGIASVSIISGSESIVPFSKAIVVKGTAVPNEVDVYLVGDTATGQIPVSNELTLLAEGVVIPDAAGTVDLAAYGLRFTAGSGTMALTDGDTAYFESRPANSKTTKITMADKSDIKNVGMLFVWPKTADGKQTIADFPKVAVGGSSFNGNTRAFAEMELTGTPLIDIDSNNELFVKTQITIPTVC